MSDIILCDHCGTSLHDPEKDVFEEEMKGHKCVPMLEERIADLEAALDSEHAVVGRNIWRFWSDKSLRLAKRSTALTEQLLRISAALAAAISLLEKGGREAAPSDRMFEQMLTDYRRALEDARSLLRRRKTSASICPTHSSAASRPARP